MLGFNRAAEEFGVVSDLISVFLCDPGQSYHLTPAGHAQETPDRRSRVPDSRLTNDKLRNGVRELSVCY